MVSLTSVSSMTSLLYLVPSVVWALLHVNKPNAAEFPKAAGWTTKEGTEV